MKYDLHIHTKYSRDSLMNPKSIIKVAKKKGLYGIAITDHNTIKGAIETLKINDNKDFQVVVGSEIRTQYGDIIGLFLTEEIKSTTFEEVIDKIKSQGGLSVLSHPYRQYKYPEKLINNVDLIEGFNARSKKADNEKAYKLALKFKKTMTAGSDSHIYFEIGRGVIIVNGELEEALKKGKTKIEGKESNYYFVHGLSVVIENIKKVSTYAAELKT